MSKDLKMPDYTPKGGFGTGEPWQVAFGKAWQADKAKKARLDLVTAYFGNGKCSLYEFVKVTELLKKG